MRKLYGGKWEMKKSEKDGRIGVEEMYQKRQTK